MGDAAGMKRQIAANSDEHEQWDVGGNTARVLQPLADVQPDHVKDHGNCQQSQRGPYEILGVRRKVLEPWAADVHRHGHARRQQSRKIEERINPVCPAGDEAVKIAEGLFAPHVQSTLGGIAGGQLNDDERGGEKEEQRREHPQADGRCSVVRRGSYPARTEHGCNVEQQHVPETHGATKLAGLSGGLSRQAFPLLIQPATSQHSANLMKSRNEVRDPYQLDEPLGSFTSPTSEVAASVIRTARSSHLEQDSFASSSSTFNIFIAVRPGPFPLKKR